MIECVVNAGQIVGGANLLRAVGSIDLLLHAGEEVVSNLQAHHQAERLRKFSAVAARLQTVLHSFEKLVQVLRCYAGTLHHLLRAGYSREAHIVSQLLKLVILHLNAVF